MVYSAINIGILDTLNSPPFIPPQAGGRDFWVYSVCSIYNKCLASQPLKTVQRKRNVLKHPVYVKLYLTFSYLSQLVMLIE